jgi:hypothetical protein
MSVPHNNFFYELCGCAVREALQKHKIIQYVTVAFLQFTSMVTKPHLHISAHMTLTML